MIPDSALARFAAATCATAVSTASVRLGDRRQLVLDRHEAFVLRVALAEGIAMLDDDARTMPVPRRDLGERAGQGLAVAGAAGRTAARRGLHLDGDDGIAPDRFVEPAHRRKRVARVTDRRLAAARVGRGEAERLVLLQRAHDAGDQRDDEIPILAQRAQQPLLVAAVERGGERHLEAAHLRHRLQPRVERLLVARGSGRDRIGPDEIAHRLVSPVDVLG
jgi:hypothetical protein